MTFQEHYNKPPNYQIPIPKVYPPELSRIIPKIPLKPPDQNFFL